VADAADAAVAAATGTNDEQQQQQNDGNGHDNVDSSSRSDSTKNSLEHEVFPFFVAMMMTVGGVALLWICYHPHNKMPFCFIYITLVVIL